MWVEHARQFYTQPFLANEHGEAYNFVRRSEKSSDEMRDPMDRKSSERYRIFWLEARLGDMYEEMVRIGKLHFADFHFSWPLFLDLRPFYVKNATRETCMCVYHLRFSEFSKGLISYRKTLRDQKISQCKCSWPVNDRFLQQQLICARKAGSMLDNVDCINQRCTKCSGAKNLTSGIPGSLCANETRDLPATAATPLSFASRVVAAAPVAAAPVAAAAPVVAAPPPSSVAVEMVGVSALPSNHSTHHRPLLPDVTCSQNESLPP